MFFELIGTVVAGVATGIGLWALNRLLKRRLPGWIIPAGAGAAMLIATISSEKVLLMSLKPSTPGINKLTFSLIKFELAVAVRKSSSVEKLTIESQVSM